MTQPICQPFIIVTHNPEYSFRVVDKNCDGVLKAEDGDDVFIASRDDFLNLIHRVPERVWNHLLAVNILKPVEEYAVERDHHITIWKTVGFSLILFMGHVILKKDPRIVFFNLVGVMRPSSSFPDWT